MPMNIVLWIVGTLLIIFSVYVMVLGIIRQIGNYIESKKEDGSWSSSIPLIATLTFVMGYAILPIEFSFWSFLIVLADVETLMILIGLPLTLLFSNSEKGS
jgi:hypothetical protein